MTMFKNNAYRVYDMTLRTDKAGETLTIISKSHAVTLTEDEARRLCVWLMGAFQIAMPVDDAELGRTVRRLIDIPQQLDARLTQLRTLKVLPKRRAKAAVKKRAGRKGKKK